ncbi:hypothetical protein EPN44_14025 [bacterium]|nr:MAG: hypothetical protein EPN44_14025 [bacterium]
MEEENPPIEALESELSDHVLENARLLAERRLSRTLSELPLEGRLQRLRLQLRFIGKKIAEAAYSLAPDLVEVSDEGVRCTETGRSIRIVQSEGQVVLERSWLSAKRRSDIIEELQIDDSLLYLRLASSGGEWASLWELTGEILEE